MNNNKVVISIFSDAPNKAVQSDKVPATWHFAADVARLGAYRRNRDDN